MNQQHAYHKQMAIYFTQKIKFTETCSQLYPSHAIIPFSSKHVIQFKVKFDIFVFVKTLI